MRARSFAALSAVMYFLSALAFFCLIGIDVFPEDGFSHLIKFVTALSVFICGYAAAFFRCITLNNSEAKQQHMKRALIFLFAAYLFILIDFTLIDNSFGRQISNIFIRRPDEITLYLKNNTNLIPFETVRLFIKGWMRNSVSFSVFAENILGNLVAFMPLAFFVPAFFRYFRRPICFFAVTTVTVIVIELLQALLLTGSADIDDYILNAAGAMLAFFLLRIKAVGVVLNKITLGVWSKDI